MNMKKFLIPAFLLTVAMTSAAELKLSNFLTNTTFNGDARIMQESFNYDTTDPNMDRTKTRLRLNMATKINDNFSVKAQLRFTNDYELGKENTTSITSSNTGTTSTLNSSPFLTVQNLFLQYTKGNNTILAGRTPDGLYSMSNMFLNDLDKDLVGFKTIIKDTDLRAGYIYLSNASGVSGGTATSTAVGTATTSTENIERQHVLYVQALQNININKDLLKVELSGYRVEQDEKNTTYDDQNIIVLGADYTHNFAFKTPKYAQFRTEYMKTSADNANTGLSAGIKYGSKDLKKFGDWVAEVEYKFAEKDNYLAKSNNNNRENVKLYAQTYVASNTNLEVEYNKSKTYDLALANNIKSKARDYDSLALTLNVKF